MALFYYERNYEHIPRRFCSFLQGALQYARSNAF